MDIDMQIELIDRLLSESNRKKDSWRKMAIAIGVSPQAVQKWKDSGIPPARIKAVSIYLGVDRSVIDPDEFNIKETSSNVKESAEIYSLSEYRDKIHEVPVYKAHYAMGNGYQNFEHDVICKSVTLTRKFIRENIAVCTTPDNLVIVTALGDSMEPLFSDRDQLFMDTGVKVAEIDAVYGFEYMGEFYLKRLQRIPGNGLRAISDNLSYEKFDIEHKEQFYIHGRIVGGWNFKRI